MVSAINKKYLQYLAAILVGAILGFLILFTTDQDKFVANEQFNSLNENSFNEAVSKASPAVVNIYSDVIVDSRRSQFPFSDRFNSIFGFNKARVQSSLGSGVIFYSNGYILTNQHIIGERNIGITVELSNGRKEEAKYLLDSLENE